MRYGSDVRGKRLVVAALVAFARIAHATPTPDAPAPSAPPEPLDAPSPNDPPPPPPQDDATGSDDADAQQPPDDEGDDGGPPLHEDNEYGPLIFIESVGITGNSATDLEIIRRALPIAPGDVLHSSDKRLRDVRYKVLALGYFRDVIVTMRKGVERGHVVVEVHVVERGTIVLNRLWLGISESTAAYGGLDLTERNLLGLGIALGGGFVYGEHGDIEGSRDQWAGEIRLADTSLRGTAWGVNGAMTLVHGSEPYRTSGGPNEDLPAAFGAFDYRRFAGRAGTTYDVTALSRLSASVRVEQIDATLPTAPTQTLSNGEIVGIDPHLQQGGSRVVTLGFGFDRDTRPDPVLPHSGDRGTVAAEIGSAAFGSSYDFATLFARYEKWWPLQEERQTLGLRFAGGLVLGNADEFDRIYIADVDHSLTPRALGLVLSTASPFDLLGTREYKPTYGDIGGNITGEYAITLFRGTGKKRVYGGDLFFDAGIWALAETEDLHERDAAIWKSLPMDLFFDAGVRIDTDVGIFELAFSNALGRLR